MRCHACDTRTDTQESRAVFCFGRIRNSHSLDSQGQRFVWPGLASSWCQQAEVVVWGVVGAGLRPTNVFHLVKGGAGGLSTTARPWGRVLMARLPLFVHLLGARKWTDLELYQFLLRALAQH